MKVLNFLRPENGLTEDPLYYLNFEKYEDTARDCYLFMADFYKDLYSGRYDDKEKVVLTLEEPNFCVAPGDKVRLHEVADKILTICPYTAELFDNRQFVFFPFSEDWIPLKEEKTIDVCYFGSMPKAVPWESYMRNVVAKHNFRFGHYSMGNVPRCSYADKMRMYAQSKVSVVHGLCNINPETAQRYRDFPKGTENEAFQYLEKGWAPQIKSRMFEAAFARSLILCQKMELNPIERFFTPDQDFLYFDDEADLDRVLTYVLENYDFFDKMRESAYNKACTEYTTKSFVQKYLR